MGHLLPRCSHLQALISPCLGWAPELPSAALLPLIVHFIPASESVPEELSGSLSGCPSVSQGGATAKGFRDPALCSLPRAELWPQGAPKPFTRAREAIPCGSSFGPLIPHFYLQTWAPAFQTPTLPLSHGTRPSAVYSHILQDKIWQQMLPIKICVLGAVFTMMRTKAFQASHCALSFCHVQLPREEFSSGKTWDRILCPPNCSCKWAQNSGCSLAKEKHRYKRGFYWGCSAALWLQTPPSTTSLFKASSATLSLRQTSPNIFLLCRRKNEPKNEPCFF